MKLKGTHSIRYTLEGKKEEIIVEVELKQISGLMLPGQNVYEGFALVNGKNFEHPQLKSCVNAQYMAESIALEHIQALREKHGSKLRVKKDKK